MSSALAISLMLRLILFALLSLVSLSVITELCALTQFMGEIQNTNVRP